MKFRGTIELGKINKKCIFTAEKTGHKYLDVYITETKSEHADFVIMESPNKAMRDEGIKGEIIGNMTEWDAQQGAQPEKEVQTPEIAHDSDDLPF